MGDRHTLAEKLLDGYRSKAMELLMDYLKDEKVCADTERYIGQHHPSPARINTTYDKLPAATPARSHRYSSSLPQSTARRKTSDAPHGQHTPSNSAGSGISQRSSLTAPGVERIWLLSHDEEGKDQLVISRCGTGKDYLIQEKVLFNRGFGTEQTAVDELVNVPGREKAISVSTAVSLTWRRPKALSTRNDTFYIVPNGFIDSDVVLASDESLEGQYASEDVQDTYSPKGRHHPRIVTVDEVDPPIHQRAPTAHTHPYNQTSPTPSPKVLRASERVGNMREAKRPRESEPTAPSAPSRHTDHGQPSETASFATAQGVPSAQLQVNGFWGATPISMFFNPNESGEKFFQAFLRWAVKRKRSGDVDRSRMTLWLKANKTMPDDAAQDLSLDYDELENLWATAVAWIHENKSDKAPHLYATVEMMQIEDG